MTQGQIIPQPASDSYSQEIIFPEGSAQETSVQQAILEATAAKEAAEAAEAKAELARLQAIAAVEAGEASETKAELARLQAIAATEAGEASEAKAEAARLQAVAATTGTAEATAAADAATAAAAAAEAEAAAATAAANTAATNATAAETEATAATAAAGTAATNAAAAEAEAADALANAQRVQRGAHGYGDEAALVWPAKSGERFPPTLTSATYNVHRGVPCYLCSATTSVINFGIVGRWMPRKARKALAIDFAIGPAVGGSAGARPLVAYGDPTPGVSALGIRFYYQSVTQWKFETATTSGVQVTNVSSIPAEDFGLSANGNQMFNPGYWTFVLTNGEVRLYFTPHSTEVPIEVASHTTRHWLFSAGASNANLICNGYTNTRLGPVVCRWMSEEDALIEYP